MTFGARLREMRLRRGFTQEQLGQKIGVAKSTLTGYEKGNREPDISKIKKILEALELEADDLLEISKKPAPRARLCGDAAQALAISSPLEQELVGIFSHLQPALQQYLLHMAKELLQTQQNLLASK